MKDTFLIVDGNSLLHRAFHALPVMNTPEGIYTNALHGFVMMLLRAIKEQDARYVAVCFDEHAPTFRHLAYAEYKAGRQATPEELKQQFVTVRQLLDDMGIRRYGIEGWEADDLLGTLSRLGAEAGAAPLLLTGDRDALQLVSNDVRLMFTRKGISETVIFTPAMVYEEYGFTPEQVTDWKGLAGDSSDNIPGIAGIGDKTAVKLLQKYGTLQNALAHAGEEKGKLAERLAGGEEIANKCKWLATIRRDAPVDFTLDNCRLPLLSQKTEPLRKLRLMQCAKRVEELFGTPVQDADDPFAQQEAAPAAPQPTFELTETVEPDAVSRWLETVTGPVALCVTDRSVSLACEGRALYVPLGGDLLTPGMDPAEALGLILPALAKLPPVVHDCKSLLHLLARLGLPLPESFDWDIMLGAYLMDPQQKSYSLLTLLEGLPEDARGVWTVAQTQRSRVTADGMLSLMNDIELPLARVLYDMEHDGFRVDAEALRTLGTQWTAEIEALRNQVFAACHVAPFNLNSTQQLGQVLFEQLGLPHGKKTTRGYSTAVEVLEDLRDIAPQVIEPLLKYRQLMKLQGTYIEGLLRLMEEGGRVHSHFDQTATATGRISSSEPNLQNIPVRTELGREIRRAFLPREGWVLLDADYSQIELRLMAHFSGDEALCEAFREGQDIHARTAAGIFGVPQEQVTSTLRSQAKAVNFGIIYGISGFGLARNTGVSRQEAARFIEQYFRRYPGVKRFMDEAVSRGGETGYAVTLMGRRRYLPQLQSSKQTIREFGKRAAMNTPIQGTAADIIKLAMVRVSQALRREGLRSRLILQVHDELLLECPPEEVAAASDLLRRCMEQVISLSVPLVAEVHQGSSWAEAK